MVDSDYKSNLQLRKFSSFLFSVDKDSNIILNLIAKNGPSSEYQLGKLGFNRGLNRYSIQRKIRGRETSDNSLIEKGYLVQIKSEKFKNTQKIKKIFGLTFKGFLTSLAGANYEDNYLVQNYFNFLKNEYQDPLLAKLSIQLIKYNLLLILYWHHSKGLTLTNLHNSERYFLDWILSNNLMRIDTRYFSIYSQDTAIFSLIREKLFALLSVVCGLIKKLEKNYEADWAELDFNNKNAIYEKLWKNIQHWPIILERMQEQNYYLEYATNPKSILITLNEKKFIKETTRILNSFKIHNIKPDNKPVFPSEFIL